MKIAISLSNILDFKMILNTLSLIAKADIDDKLKNLERKLNLTQQQLSAEKFKNSQLDLKSKSANLEINKLRKSIE